MTSQVVDGIDLAALEATVKTMREQPQLARFTFQTDNQWIDGTHSRASVRAFYGGGQLDQSRHEVPVFDEDEPPILFGHNQGVNPVEYLLVALSGCLTTALVASAATRGVQLRSLRSHVEGDIDLRGFLDIDPNVPKGYQEIRVTFQIEADAPHDMLQELVNQAQVHSPVYNTLTHGVPVNVGLKAA